MNISSVAATDAITGALGALVGCNGKKKKRSLILDDDIHEALDISISKTER